MSMSVSSWCRAADRLPRRGPSIGCVYPVPDRIADRREEAGMGSELVLGRRMRARGADLDLDPLDQCDLDHLLVDRPGDDVGEAEADLAPAGQLDIALGEQLGVDQRAMLDAQAAVDAEAGAERIEAV